MSNLLFQESKGYEFESETDTETIAKLIKYVFDNRETKDITFSTLVERVIQQLVSYRSHLFKSFIFYKLLLCKFAQSTEEERCYFPVDFTEVLWFG
jgi:hypothetical protein